MYGAEASEIYELLHQGRGKDYRAEAEEIARQVRARMPGAASLLDVACGTGAHLEHFRPRFDRVEGLELSAPMAEAARRRLPGVTVHTGDMRDFSLDGSFSVITCMFGSIGYLAGPRELAAALRRFARHLQPGGVVAVDPWWFPETFLDGHVATGTTVDRGRALARVSHSVRVGDASRVEVHYLVADAASGVRHFSETHLISLFTRRQYEDAFSAAGLDVEYLDGLHNGRGLFLGVLDASAPVG
ncbi:class I SAM-dependent methyltransferase [Streptomyces sp. DvalAA-19]|uniref:class I SAM-dependent DNA methyltransferase n=1 Tax=Streptomyces sp. DvalAA-19 TaxID=1839761 RepID=UPI00081B8320|nr:class I SAM-dependent methyltransferase [Streptomyces sp. DvalAA-19]SCD60656.1 dTDP-3-amino-3,6-dideoxy-alpha-D-glucopyranose N,N-dimethyltransferase/dTDP-3-amino-3,4,6-trideoxy-alpha-D-glucopyranose N,N-dimethyltransferase [Streptomyces sp. DvalAA-19]